jgi:murein DD-endopeptidase MepM/ murein hydrolase activator NlpD
MKFRNILKEILSEQDWASQGTWDMTTGVPIETTPKPKDKKTSISTKSKVSTSGSSKKIIDFFVSKGLEPHQAAGVAANFQAESGLNPSAIGDSGKAHGLAQWRDSRWTNLQNFAKEQNKSWKDFNLQLDFAWDEMTNKYPSMLSSLKSSKTSDEATEIVMLNYEIPSDQSNSAIRKRQKIAQGYFESQGTDSGSSSELKSYFANPVPQMIRPSGLGVYGAPRTHGKHDGIDIAAPSGTPIYSIMSGEITARHNSGRCGNGLTITNGDWSYTFCHASKILKSSGSVNKGEKLAEVGETGSATGPHIHFKIEYKDRPVDPTPYFF